MRLQDSQANCGTLAVRNALKSLGIERSTEELEVLLGTTATAGTPPGNVLKGLKKLEELKPRVVEESRQTVARLCLDDALRSGRPVVLLVDDWEHWVAAIGRLGQSRVLVADSADSELVLSYTWEAMMERWERDGARKPYWAVVL